MSFTPELLAHLRELMTDERALQFESRAELRTRHLALVLENVHKPHNISAVLRTADCFGIQDVHVVENLNKFRINKEISLGASKWLHVHRHGQHENNTRPALLSLKEKGYQVIATSPHKNDCEIHELPIDKPVALVFGAEVEGISKEAMELADGFVRIPMFGFSESYNISVAAALSCYELTKRLRSSNVNWALPQEEQNKLLFEWFSKSIKSSEQVITRFNAEQNRG